jgi:hypothetical protein
MFLSSSGSRSVFISNISTVKPSIENNMVSKSAFISSVSTVNPYTGSAMGYKGTGMTYGGGLISTSSTSSTPSTTPSTDSPAVLTYYSQLATIVNTINPIVYQYSLGNIDYVITNFTTILYYTLSQNLLRIQQDANTYPEYENIRQSIVRSLEGLNKSIITYKDYQSNQRQLIVVTNRSKILDNMTELKKYLDSLAGSVNLFPDIAITSIAATLKPEIAVYIRLYGFPPGGVFESEKMAFALQISESSNSTTV